MRDADAFRRASATVGWYGDPTVSWSILLVARLTEPVDPTPVRRRLAAAAREHPGLGPEPTVHLTQSHDEFLKLRNDFASEPYAGGKPLVRVAVCADEPAVLLAAHHGALDGLGLLALLGRALDVEVRTGVTGVSDRSTTAPFPLSAARRATEAIFTPPARIQPSGHALAGDVFAAHNGSRAPVGSAALTAAASAATRSWNSARGGAQSRVVAAVGASRRAGDDLLPEHRSTFLRLRLPGDTTTTQRIREMLASQPTEPDFPARSSAPARALIRLLAPRLGSTFLASNLGPVSAGDTVRSLEFYPEASGRSGVAFGAATVADTTTITVRARGRDFDDASARALLDEVVRALHTELAAR
ncbi:hypothetical protein EV193_101650 [Herbihabitans rhizosphaerae]|uniref:Condensation domain-containing protein n=1 Tax=Herbihabitans rhizosphaerae TaxID=1872711 RepID=A0A4Q7L800_9PSEU|nr:hypothetical protein [Herbihabitans rhizosphaerae]RZS44771.1 hypothetical protein EV193_101650 [Herbihabitans rhizosphaerae]